MEYFHYGIIIGLTATMMGLVVGIYVESPNNSDIIENVNLKSNIHILKDKLAKQELEKQELMNLKIDEVYSRYLTETASMGDFEESVRWNLVLNKMDTLILLHNNTDSSNLTTDEILLLITSNQRMNTPDYTIAIISASAIMAGAAISGIFGLVAIKYKNLNHKN